MKIKPEHIPLFEQIREIEKISLSPHALGYIDNLWITGKDQANIYSCFEEAFMAVVETIRDKYENPYMISPIFDGYFVYRNSDSSRNYPSYLHKDFSESDEWRNSNIFQTRLEAEVHAWQHFLFEL